MIILNIWSKWKPSATHYENKNHFKHLVKMKIIRNKHYEKWERKKYLNQNKNTTLKKKDKKEKNCSPLILLVIVQW